MKPLYRCDITVSFLGTPASDRDRVSMAFSILDGMYQATAAAPVFDVVDLVNIEKLPDLMAVVTVQMRCFAITNDLEIMRARLFEEIAYAANAHIYADGKNTIAFTKVESGDSLYGWDNIYPFTDVEGDPMIGCAEYLKLYNESLVEQKREDNGLYEEIRKCLSQHRMRYACDSNGSSLSLLDVLSQGGCLKRGAEEIECLADAIFASIDTVASCFNCYTAGEESPLIAYSGKGVAKK